MQVMTEQQLHETLSQNIKKYRKGKYTQEQLAEKIGVSSQNINDIEGKRRWPRESTLIKIADALEIEVYQLFIPNDLSNIQIENTDENEKIRTTIQQRLVSDFRKSMNNMLDKWSKKDL
ncbi:MAG: helix-turn-helix domain-containing protein [Treponema sp.]|nr:helix-turn-helix domain-containing protein [Treponema sp.]